MKKIVLLLLFLSSFASLDAFAAPGLCTIAGQQRFDGTVMEYCDGTKWRLIGAPNRITGSCTTSSGKQNYTGTGMEYCKDSDPKTFYNTNGMDTAVACAINGQQRYLQLVQPLTVMQYCNGTTWINMSSIPFNPMCPIGFIPVPSSVTPYAPYDFCVSKYHMKAVKKTDGVPQDDGGATGSYFPESRPDFRPWGNINYLDAYDECASLGSDFHLITNAEWMTIAKSIEQNSANWSNNKKPGDAGFSPNDFIPTGHSDGFCPGPPGCQVGQNYLAASPNDNLGCFGTGNDVPPTSGNCPAATWQKRILTLSNGAVIWDFAGNINSWVDPDGTGSTLFYPLAPSNESVPSVILSTQQLNEPRILSGARARYANPLFSPTMATPQENAFLPTTNPSAQWDQNGFGTVSFLTGALGSASNMGLVRGGYYAETRATHTAGTDPFYNFNKLGIYDRRVGIYSAWLSKTSASGFTNVGFRCVYRPPY